MELCLVKITQKSGKLYTKSKQFLGKIIVREYLIWDTTLDPVNYPTEVKDKFFKLSVSNRHKFVKWLGLISKQFNKNFDWWIKLPSSRDPYKSYLYKNIIILVLLKDKKLTNKLKKIYFENNGILEILKKEKKINLNLKKIIIKKPKSNFLLIFSSIIFSFLVFFIVKLQKKINLKKNFSGITLLDTYLDTKIDVKDFVFSNLMKNLKPKQKNEIIFVPNFLFNKNIFSLYRNIKTLSLKNYLFKEHYITLNEFLGSIKYNLFGHTQFKGKNFKNFDKLNISPLLLKELASKTNFYSELQSRLKLKFILNLSTSNIKIKKVICRFENQSVDRAWNYGFKKYFPFLETLGYQDFLYYPHLSNQSPTKYESRAKIIPEKIIVTGKTVKKNRVEFNKNQKIVIGPSLNKQNIFSNSRCKSSHKFVLALCGIKPLDELMISWIYFVLKTNKKLKVIIKPHPILPLNKIENFRYEYLSDQIIINNMDIARLLKLTEVLITSGPTSVMYESIMYGCKLFYLFLDPYDLILKKKIKISKKIFIFINDKTDLLKNLNNHLKEKHVKKNFKAVEDYYTKINKKNIKLFY
tara:strand:+ start:1350 stop:3089 length:1740 start_codon:yes stop_codon:yes gene_type:complete